MKSYLHVFRNLAVCWAAALAAVAITACDDDDLSSASDPNPTDTGGIGTFDPAPVRTPLQLVTDASATVGEEPAISNIKATETSGIYNLSIDGATQGDIYIFTRPLTEELTKRNVSLVFMYKTDAQIPRFSLSFYNPETNSAVPRGEIKPVSQVDVDKDGWAVAKFVISNDVNEYDWGHIGHRLKIWLRPEQNTTCTMQIKDICLESTDIEQGTNESADANVYNLTFTPGRGAWWQMENAHGIYSGVSFTRQRSTYLLLFNDSYNDKGTALEHFISSDPLSRVLSYDVSNKIEIQFKYRASAAWQLVTGLYPFEDPSRDWAASIRIGDVPASADAEPDKDGWALYKHDITSAVRAKSWGRSVDNKDQQIRFSFRAADGSLHPELAGLSQLELKDVCIVVSDRDPSEMNAIDLTLELGSYRTPDVSTMTETNGEYDFNFYGEFPAQEYEVFTSAIPDALDPNKEYFLQLEYQCEEEINSFQILYFSKNGGGDNQWAEKSGDLLPTEEGEWKSVSISLADRLAHGNWGSGAGQVLRPHFYDIPGRTTAGQPNFGKPLHVKVRNVRLVSF